MPKSVNIVVEDSLSNAILTTLLNANGGHKVAGSYPIKSSWENGILQTGYGYIKKNLPAFNKASEVTPFVVLFDQDDRPCPIQTINDWLQGQNKHHNLVIRVAVKEVEAWLIADRSGLAEFLSVPKKSITLEPELLSDPKAYIVQLAKNSQSSIVRQDIAPGPRSSATTGPYYTRALANFARTSWDFHEAATRSQSLARAIANISTL